MDEAKTQVVKKLQEASNVLVTVSSNPSVDQLAACIGLTLALNKLGKHATAVYSGKTPSTLEFLKPQETLENNTDSLRDFIISLDKSKADKLRYKVEDKVVKIFITPYRTSITENDLEFSQGDFNVDVVIAIGVHEQKDLDQAITSHGRILHDATVVAVNRDIGASVGTINVLDNTASSLCEILVPISEQMKADVLDEQIATAYLTGIVAATERFSNEKTTSNTMNISARLMGAGANQQLVATQLKAHDVDQPSFDPLKMNELAHDEAATTEDGALAIDHSQPGPDAESETDDTSLPKSLDDIHVEEVAEDQQPAPEDPRDQESRLILEPPTLGGTLTAMTTGNNLDPSTDPLSLPTPAQPILSHDKAAAQASGSTDGEIPDLKTFLRPKKSQSVVPTAQDLATPPPAAQPVEQPAVPSEPAQTLTDLEQSIGSPHVQQTAAEATAAPAEPAQEEPAVGGMHVIDPLPHEKPNLPDLTETTPEPASPEREAAPAAPEVVAPETSPQPEEAAAPPQANVDEARDAVLQAINASTDPGQLGPIEALNAQPLDMNVQEHGNDTASAAPTTAFNPDAYGIEAAGVTGEEFRMPENLMNPDAPLPADPTASSVTDPTAPPLVPPPLIPPLSPDGLPPSQENTDQPPADNPFNLPPAS